MPNRKTIYDFGINNFLSVPSMFSEPPRALSVFDNGLNPERIGAGELESELSLVKGHIESDGFESGVQGWRIDSDGNLEANDGYFRGDITAATGTFSGSVTVGAGSNYESGYNPILKVNTFAQDEIPTSLAIGDLWLDINDSNKLYRASSVGATTVAVGEWVLVRDSDIANALSDASDAQATADGKVVTFIQDTEPTAEGVGDLWIDSNDSNKLYRWNNSEWIEVRDTGIGEAISDASAAQDTADGKIVSFYAPFTSIPTSEGAGDIWFDTTNDNTPYRATGIGDTTIAPGEWVKIENPVADWSNVRAGTNSAALAVGDGKVLLDGGNKRIVINDGTNDRVLIGYLAGKF